MTRRNLVLGGGGVKGYAYIGCMRKLLEIPFDNYHGCSIGALFCLLLQLKVDPKDLVNVSISPKLKLNHLFLNWGLDSGKDLYELICYFLKISGMSEYTTFHQLNKVTGKTLSIYSTDISINEPVIFSTSETPDFPVFKAVLASAALPFIYPPIDNKYIDGFVKNTFPYVDLEETKTLYIYLSSKGNIQKVAESLQEYILQVLVSLRTPETLPKGTIIIDCGRISSVSFGINKKEILRLIKKGFESLESLELE